jgi:phosphatidylserine/phosphatidylglycerophosphate/cardiolipin synthase-like enzyme
VSDDELGLSPVPEPLLRQLAEAVAAGRIACPLAETRLQATGLGPLARTIAPVLAGLDAAATLAVLRVAIAERVHRAPPRISLVWTGPEGNASTANDTALTIRALFAGARRSVVVGGYAFDKPEILAPLHAVMVAYGVTATFFVDIDGEARTAAEAEEFANEAIRRFLRDVWTFGAPRPEVYYDPRTAMPGPPWASLHAKCVVVDDARALITSANFTDRGQTRNIEAGVLVEDAAFASELAGQWRMLIGAGLVRRSLDLG